MSTDTESLICFVNSNIVKKMYLQKLEDKIYFPSNLKSEQEEKILWRERGVGIC